MQRRTFLSTLAAATLTGSAAETADIDLVGRASGASTVPELQFGSTSSLLNASGGKLTDGQYVPVWAEDTASNNDADGNGDAVDYGDTQIPLVAADGSVVGLGSMFVQDDTNWQYGNEEFLLNVWDAHAGSGTVLWDEGHSNYYTLSKFSEFESYAENNGYTVQATTNLSADLSGASAVVVTSPSTAFSSSEKSDLADFVANGGAVFLHSQSDYSNYDETANLNDLAAGLGLAFRFNDDEVTDDLQNGGNDYQPTTDEFDTSFPYFDDRDGLGLDPTKTYTVPVTEVLDGDTVKVDVDGTIENVRILGLDTPEKSSNQQHERVQEWEGIEDLTYLANAGSDATQYAKDRLSGETIDLTFDSNSSVRDAFGRLLGYIHYDSGSGSRDTFYNEEIVADGHARVYDGGSTTHDSFIEKENTARASGLNVWSDSDPDNSSEIRNRAVDDLFFPVTSSVTTASGSKPTDVPVSAESSATQTLDGGDSFSGDLPLVALDETNRVGVFGSPLIDEGYESAEGYAVDTSSFENFVFLTNTIDHLSSKTGDVLIDGGHGQFEAGYALSAEDAAYYLRFLEGVDIGFQGVNDLANTDLSGARAIVVTAPEQAYSQAELDALSTYADNGGSVILVGSGHPLPAARDNLNDIANALGTSLRVNADQVTDSTNNVNSDSEVPTTTNFDTSYPLFSAYDGSSGGGGSGQLSVKTIHEDAAGDDAENLNDEYVVFENAGSGQLDMTNWEVQDEAGKTYTFGSFTLDAGATVTLHSGQGTDTATDVYWGRTGSAVWNNGGDTVFVYDDAGTKVLEEPY